MVTHLSALVEVATPAGPIGVEGVLRVLVEASEGEECMLMRGIGRGKEREREGM